MEMQEDLPTLLDRLFNEHVTWPDLIKRLRASFETDIFTAEKMALSHHGWRKFCNRQINQDRGCRKQAALHIKLHGEHSLVLFTGESFLVIEPD